MVRIPVHYFPKFTKVQIPVDPVGTAAPEMVRKKPSKPDPEKGKGKKKAGKRK